MVHIPGDGLIDLSIMPWLQCDLECPHCMYDAGPENYTSWMSTRMLGEFLRTVNWNDINSVGFYGGEMFLDLKGFSQYIKKVVSAQEYAGIKPRKMKPMWCISNGTFSQSNSLFSNVIRFAHIHKLRVYISTTPYQKAHQHPRITSAVSNTSNFRFKKDDTKGRLLPMGRNYVEDWYCTRRCMRLERDRLAIKPNGDVIYQKCDGIYPTIASIKGNNVSWNTLGLMMRNQFNCPMLDKNIDLGEPSWVDCAARRLE